MSVCELERLEDLRTLKLAEMTGRKPWHPHSYQVPPPKPWHLWLMLGGRGAGKTDGCAHYFDKFMRQHPGYRGSIIAPTLGDAVESCVNGASGLKAYNPTVTMTGGAGGLHVYWPNGSEAKLFGASDPQDIERLRAGGNRHINWWEELAAWRYLDECVDHAEFGLRLGNDPHVIASTTPKPRQRLRELIADPRTAVTHGTMFDNAANLPAEQVEALKKKFAGTRKGRQELEGELIEEAAGALWDLDDIQYCRGRQFSEAPAPTELTRIVVAVDPSGAKDEDSGSDEIGIIVCGYDSYTNYGYVLADYTLTDGPKVWAKKVVEAYHLHDADLIVVEKNYGGEMVRATIHSIERNVPVKVVNASTSKQKRAEPVSMLYEQRRIFHVQPMPKLEDQLCTWVPGESKESPDRLDALVWGLRELMLTSTEAKVVSGKRYGDEPVYRKGDLVLTGDIYIDKERTW